MAVHEAGQSPGLQAITSQVPCHSGALLQLLGLPTSHGILSSYSRLSEQRRVNGYRKSGTAWLVCLHNLINTVSRYQGVKSSKDLKDLYQ